MTDEIEVYVPRPLSLAWKVMHFLIENPGQELTRSGVAQKFNCAVNSVDAMLQTAIARECLKKKRNSLNEVVWYLGLVKNCRLDPVPVVSPTHDEDQAALAEAARTPAAGSKWTAVAAPASHYRPTNPSLRTEPAPAAAKEPAIKVAEPLHAVEHSSPAESVAGRLHDSGGPIVVQSLVDTVQLPRDLTPALIAVIRTHPRTSFSNKEDEHHAIGWLLEAYAVIVELETSTRTRAA